ncbi:MAG: CAP domain-containing protein [Pseudomonadota bacterium]
MLTRRTIIPFIVFGVSLATAACSTTEDVEVLANAPTAPVRTGIVTGQTLGSLNALRTSRGRAPMVADPVLGRAALEHAQSMARSGRLSHARFRSRMRAIGAGPAAENIAAGQTSVSSVMRAWSGSSGHRRNMLAPYSRVGVAVASNPASGNRPYWVMVVAN